MGTLPFPSGTILVKKVNQNSDFIEEVLDCSDINAVATSGNQTITGAKTFLNDLTVSGTLTIKDGHDFAITAETANGWTKLGNLSQKHLAFMTGGTLRWYIDDNTGDLVPYADALYSVGEATKGPLGYNVSNGTARGRLNFAGNTLLLQTTTAHDLSVATNTTGNIALATSSSGTTVTISPYNSNGTHKTIFTNDKIYPGTDGRLSLGDASHGFTSFYVTGGFVGLQASVFGYSSSYKALVVGSVSGSQTVCLGYDPATNASGSFSGNGTELICRNGLRIKTPNSSNNSFLNYLRFLDGITDIYSDTVTHIGTGADLTIRQSTVDGSDSKSVILAGGGSVGNAYGAWLSLRGNEYAITGGQALLTAGSSSGSKVILNASASNGSVELQTNSTARWLVDSNGHLIPNNDNSYDIGLDINRVRNLYAANEITVSGSPGIKLGRDLSSGFVDSTGDNNVELRRNGNTLVTLGLSSVFIDEDLVVNGDLTVSGTTTTINTENLLIEDNQIILNSTLSGSPTEDGGILLNRGSSTNASILWDESEQVWKFGLEGSEEPVSVAGSFLLKTNNLSDVNNADTARANISGAKSGINSDITQLNDVGLIQNDSTLMIGTSTANELQFKTSDTLRMFIATGGYLVGNGFLGVRLNTSVAADTGSIELSSGGSSVSTARGAYLQLFGVNAASYAGAVKLAAADSSTGFVDLMATNASASVRFFTAATERWNISSSGHLLPSILSETYDIGSTTRRVQTLYSKYLNANNTVTINSPASTAALSVRVNSSGGFAVDSAGNINIYGGIYSSTYRSYGADLTVGSVTNHALHFVTNNSSRWSISTGGDLVPQVDSTFNIGDTSHQVKELHVDTIAGGLDLQIKTNGSHLKFSSTDLLPNANLGANLGSASYAFNGINVRDIKNPSSYNGRIIMSNSKELQFYFNTGSGDTHLNTLGNQGDFVPIGGGQEVGISTLKWDRGWFLNGISNFTGEHLYMCKAGENLEPGEAVKLVDGLLERCSSENDPTCVGILDNFQETNPDNFKIKTDNDILEDSLFQVVPSGAILASVAAVGDCFTGDNRGFRVCSENGNISAGDLLATASGYPGHLKKQSDDVIHSYTVGKALQNVDFGDSPTASGIYGFIYCG